MRLQQEKSRTGSYLRDILDWRPGSAIDWLLVAMVAISVLFTSVVVLDAMTTPLVLHDCATKIATELRAAQADAREQGRFVKILVRPMTTRPGSITVEDNSGILKQWEIPAGVSGIGSVTFDPQGAPLQATTLVMRKGRHRSSITVSQSGEVSIPMTLIH